MDKQELFDQAMTGMARQGWKRSEDHTGTCLYRGPGGLKCPVGHLLTDAEAKAFEGLSAQTLVATGRLPKRFDGLEEFLCALQTEHDDAVDPSWRLFAIDHDLEFREEVYNAG